FTPPLAWSLIRPFLHRSLFPFFSVPPSAHLFDHPAAADREKNLNSPRPPPPPPLLLLLRSLEICPCVRSGGFAMARSSFKMEHPLERRQAESARIREKYPDRIPVIVERAEKTDVPDIDKKKYLVPADLTVGQFVYVVRKRIKLSPEKAIFVFVKNILPPTAAMMSAIYEENKDEDGFLYMTYSGENTFGSL
ncbi:hypothetical protein EUGRSUZ_K00796, partial [Eucalyptus grandis]